MGSVTSTGCRSIPQARTDHGHRGRNGQRTTCGHLEHHGRRATDDGGRRDRLVLAPIPVLVPIEEKVQATARADVDVAECPDLGGEHAEHRQEQTAAADLVGLGRPGGQQPRQLGHSCLDEAPERGHELRVVGEAGVGGEVRVPLRKFAARFVEDQMVGAGEQQYRLLLLRGSVKDQPEQRRFAGDSRGEGRIQRCAAGRRRCEVDELLGERAIERIDEFASRIAP